jgi:hypothetical protein
VYSNRPIRERLPANESGRQCRMETGIPLTGDIEWIHQVHRCSF